MAQRDLERGLLFLLSGLGGYQDQRNENRIADIRASDQDLAKRRIEGDERRARISELDDLGAPLDVIERGLKLYDDPSSYDTAPNEAGIRIGRALSAEEESDLSAAERFLKDRRGAARNTKFYDPNTGEVREFEGNVKLGKTAKTRPDVTTNELLSRIKDLSSRPTKTYEEMEEQKQLEAEYRRRAKVAIPEKPKTPPAKETYLDRVKKGVKERFSGKKRTHGGGMKMQGLEID